MPYGMMSKQTRDAIESHDGNTLRTTLIERVGNDPTVETILTIDTIVGGALDESFDVSESMADEIGQIIADSLKNDPQVEEPWDVVLYQSGSGDGDIRSWHSQEEDDDAGRSVLDEFIQKSNQDREV